MRKGWGSVALVLGAFLSCCAVAQARPPVQDALLTQELGVPVYGFAAGSACDRDALTLACVHGYAPPIYVRDDVLLLAHRQLRDRALPQSSGSEAAAEATRGLSVLLHEWAHTAYGIRDEAQAQCYAGQWLGDLMLHDGFAPSRIALAQRYFWAQYRTRRDAYASPRCFDAAWDAPDLYSGLPVARDAARLSASVR